MALKAKDLKHAEQIKAGIKGQKKGLKFEKILTDRINAIKKYCFLGEPVPHIVNGKPEIALLTYIVQNEPISKKIIDIKCHWLGGLATSGKGDELFDENGSPITACKSDILIDFVLESKEVKRIGVSVKTCNTSKPTNAQLFCSTAQAFCKMLNDNGVAVSSNFENSLKKFCGNDGFTPAELLSKSQLKQRACDDRRFFYEELGDDFHKEAEELFKNHQDDITRLLLQKAYKNDPYAPTYVFHQRNKSEDINNFPMAIFSVDQLVDLSKQYQGYTQKEYKIKKGTWKSDPNTHLAPRFGCIQFQRLGNKQNATQFQFNLEASYFYKITGQKGPS